MACRHDYIIDCPVDGEYCAYCFEPIKEMEAALSHDRGSSNKIYRACIDILNEDMIWPEDEFGEPIRGILILDDGSLLSLFSGEAISGEITVLK